MLHAGPPAVAVCRPPDPALYLLVDKLQLSFSTKLTPFYSIYNIYHSKRRSIIARRTQKMTAGLEAAHFNAVSPAPPTKVVDHHILALARLLGRLAAREAVTPAGQCNLHE
jgi:hypothetical protein